MHLNKKGVKMAEYRTIIVATDLTISADRAVEKAVKLAERGKSELLIVHVIDKGIFGVGFEDEAKIKKAEQKLKEHYKTIQNANFLVLSGKPANEIIALAAVKNAALVVVGDHAPMPLKDFFLGTTARNITTKGKTPVLVVKTNEPIKKILVPTDFSDDSLACASFVFGYWSGLDIELLNIYQTPPETTVEFYNLSDDELKKIKNEQEEKANNEMAEFVKKLGDKNLSLGIKGAVSCEVAILEHAKKYNANLIAIGTRGVGRFSTEVMGSVAEYILRASPVDVLLHRLD
ncbi:MAG: hypothetical protein QG567_873 [Campylobacterota bacterium]|nr:hypothetical protein [Campylobacterota bacterium]